MPSPAFAVERLTPARRDDFLRFFDDRDDGAFADNPGWAKCYCHFYHVAPAIAWSSLDGAANRMAMRARIDAGEMDGFLAYAEGRVVGWLNAQPWHKLQHACARLEIVPPELPVPAHEAAAIVCFVTAPAWRRRGVARALLDGALASFAARGIRTVDAFPWKAGASAADADHYHGPLELFLAAGFVPIGDERELVVVRRELAAAA